MWGFMFSEWLFLYPYYSYTYPHTTQLSVHAWFIYVGIIGFFDQLVKIIPQNPQTLRALDLDIFLSMSHPSFIDTNGFIIIVSSGPCA